MSKTRRVALWAGGASLLVLSLLALVPVLLSGRIEAGVKQALAERLEATVDWRRVDVGLLRSFPNLSLRLHELAVVGAGQFEGDTLLSVGRFGVVLDLGSVLGSVRGKGPLRVRSVQVLRPSARLLVLEDGTASWAITRPRADPGAAGGGGLDLSLERLELRDGRVSLENRQAQLVLEIAGLGHTLAGDFSRRRLTLDSRTTADSVSLRFAGVPWLTGVRLDVAAALDADLEAKRFTIRENEIRLNELLLRTSGTAAASADSVALDVAFEAPRAEFRELLSLVPALYARDFADLQASGTMALAGQVRGGLGKNAFPALVLEARVDNGTFRYPDLPLPARDVNLALAVTNPGGDPDSTVVELERFHVLLGDDPIAGSLLLRTPVSDPDVGFRLDGRLDLANLGRTVKLARIEELSGTVVAHAGMRARLSDVDNRRFERVSAEGSIEASGVAVAGPDLRQPVRIDEARLRFSPAAAELSTLRGRLGSSDVDVTGSLENVLGFALRQQELRGRARVASTRFDLDEWRSGEGLKSMAVPANLDFALEAEADTVTFGRLVLQNARGALRVKDRRLTLDEFAMGLLGGTMTVSGYYETVDPARPGFDVDLALSGVDIPGAFAGIRTIQAFAPVARYAEGKVSARLALAGALGSDMLPAFDALSGLGSLVTSGLVLRDFPPLDGLADLLEVAQLRDPGFVDFASSFEIRDGRLFVKPFDVQLGPLAMNVAGSNGIDQSLDYTLALRLPRAVLGAGASRAIAGILDRSAGAGIDLGAAEAVTLGVRLTGTVTSPSISTSFRDAAGAAVADVGKALRDEALERVEAVEQRVDSAAEAARQRAREEAARIVAEAEARAAAIRDEAKALAETVRREAYQRADSLEARQTSPVGRVAARAAADRLRREADARADTLIREADARGDALVAEARRRAGVAAPDSSAGGHTS